MAETNGKRHGQGLRIDDARLAEMMQSGASARDAAALLGVSRQAVYARMKSLGLRSEYRPVRAIDPSASYRVSTEVYEQCRAKGAIQAFMRQRDTAKSRGIEWRFTFAEWWQMWVESGKWELRGRTKRLGGWEMSRPGDVGPYSPENVVIVTHRENMAEVHARLATRRPPRKEKRVAQCDPKYLKRVMTDPENVDRAAALFAEGRNFTEIGKVIGLHRSAVRTALVRRGLV